MAYNPHVSDYRIQDATDLRTGDAVARDIRTEGDAVSSEGPGGLQAVLSTWLQAMVAGQRTADQAQVGRACVWSEDVGKAYFIEWVYTPPGQLGSVSLRVPAYIELEG